MSLADYRRKRSFTRTLEPKGDRATTAPGRRFVIQQHAASHLHFDLRLELDGVLKSWAVPKGPSLDPSERRLAVHVEDHPLEYAGFEGIIPEGEYGAGTVIVWDNGAWEPLGNGEKDYRAGRLKFRLHGHKLTGAWMLVRMRNKPGETGDNWLLIKERDDAVVPSHQADIVRERPESVLSGRTLAEVAADRSGPKKAKAKRNGSGLFAEIRSVKGAKSTDMPRALEPTLARTADTPPAGNAWLHEIKFDGYRILAWKDHGQVQLRTRNGHDWTGRFPEIARAVQGLPVNTAILDGEVVAQSNDGISNFSALQHALSKRQTSGLVFHVFDVAYLEGHDLRQVALEARKGVLQKVLVRVTNPRLQYVEHIVGNGPKFLKHCRDLGLEGIVSKQLDSKYGGARCEDWRKVKFVQTEPFVIGGFTTARGESRLRSLIVGFQDPKGRLKYAGRVGSGFSEQTAAEIEQKLRRLPRDTCPFTNAVPKETGRDVHWIQPQLVAQVRYSGWTSDGFLRHPTFEGLRDDTDPTEVSYAPLPKRKKNVAVPKSRSKPRSEIHFREAATPQAGLLDDLAQVRLTNPKKVMYPDIGLTKADLVRYYVQIADWILPHVVDRPLSLVRCPDGLVRSQFFQKHAGPETPPAVHRLPITEDGKSAEGLYIRDLKGLASLVQIASLEIHTWGARVDNIERPDRFVIDLDPDEAVPFARVIAGAKHVRERLENVGLKSFLKTTGGKGLHVVVPLERRQGWAELKQFSKLLAERLAADFPNSYTANMSKKTRAGRIYIDYVRNSRGATAIVPYSTRARPGAPVAVPLFWEELKAGLLPNAFNVQNLAQRLTQLTADPWAEMAGVRQSLTRSVMKRIRG